MITLYPRNKKRKCTVQKKGSLWIESSYSPYVELNNNVLCCYNGENKHDLLKAYQLNEYDDIIIVSSVGAKFKLISFYGKELILVAKSTQDMNDWIEYIQSAIHKHENDDKYEAGTIIKESINIMNNVWQQQLLYKEKIIQCQQQQIEVLKKELIGHTQRFTDIADRDKINKQQKEEIESMRKHILMLISRHNKDDEIKKKMKKKNDKLKQQLRDALNIIKQNKLQNKIGRIVTWEWENDDNSWKSYPDDISKQIELLKTNQSLQYICYEIMKTSQNTAIQTNVKSFTSRNVTRFERTTINKGDEVVYKGLDYASPKLVDLVLTHLPSQQIANRFYKTINEYKIIKIESVQNHMLYDSYWDERKKLIKLIGIKQLNERMLFHGTSQNVMEQIKIQGFRKEFSNRARYGEGTYFARDAKYSLHYSCSSNYGVYKMLLCHVLCGQMYIGNNNYTLTRWPTKQNGLIYDSLVDNVYDPSVFVIHGNVRAYPMFVIHFKPLHLLY